MSMRERLLSVGESFLRVPPLLLVDEIFRISFGFGGKILEYGAKNLVTSTTAVLMNGRQTGLPPSPISRHDTWTSPSNSCAFAHPFYPSDYLGGGSSSSSDGLEDICKVGEAPGHAGSGLESQLWTSVMKGSGVVESLAGAGVVSSVVSSSTSSALFLAKSEAEYLFQLNFGDLSSLTQGISWEFVRAGEIFGCLLVFFAALIVFLLSTENLLKLYAYMGSALAAYLVYVSGPLPLFLPQTGSFAVTPLLHNLVWRTGWAGLFFFSRRFYYRQDEESGRTENGRRWSILDSLMLALCYLSGVVQLKGLVFLGILLLIQPSFWTCIPSAYDFLKGSWNETRRVQNEYGLSHLIQVECARLKVNTVFRLFWVSRAAYDASFRCCDESMAHVLRHVMSHGTETFTGIVGLTVTVSVICHSIGEFLLWVLYWGTNSETDANRFGSISTVLFFILSLQTGLTSLDPEKRLDRLLKNVVLLGTALFHALHQMVAPLLHAFRTFQGLQIRAASISLAFLSISIYSTVYLLRFSSVSTWSLAVLALAVEFKIKIIISLIISIVVYLSQLVQYPEFLQRTTAFFRSFLPSGLTRLVDKLADQLSHEDVVFYLKSFANVGEFLTGIFLFVNAVWIFMFESASAIRAIGMTIHAYFNIWCEAKKGWKIYCQRKTASMKIMSLADATEEQLASRKDDVCAICYEEMESAKVTLCSHLFHAVCLRKWLYVQNTCPLCHELLYGEDVVEELNRAHGGGRPVVVQTDDDIEEEDDMFENYHENTNLVAPLPPPQVLPQARVVFTGTDAAAVSSTHLVSSSSQNSSSNGSSSSSNQGSSPLVRDLDLINNQIAPRPPVALVGAHGENGMSVAAGVDRPESILVPTDRNNVRNNINNVNNLNPNENPRSRGGLAVLL